MTAAETTIRDHLIAMIDMIPYGQSARDACLVVAAVAMSEVMKLWLACGGCENCWGTGLLKERVPVVFCVCARGDMLEQLWGCASEERVPLQSKQGTEICQKV